MKGDTSNRMGNSFNNSIIKTKVRITRVHFNCLQKVIVNLFLCQNPSFTEKKMNFKIFVSIRVFLSHSMSQKWNLLSNFLFSGERWNILLCNFYLFFEDDKGMSPTFNLVLKIMLKRFPFCGKKNFLNLINLIDTQIVLN